MRTRPLVTLFQNRGRSPRWISELITLKDLEGEGSLALDEDRVLIPYAYVTSDKAEVATKAVFSGGVQHSLVYARYRKLDVLLRTEGNERDLAVINVREKFEQYSPPLD